MVKKPAKKPKSLGKKTMRKTKGGQGSTNTLSATSPNPPGSVTQTGGGLGAGKIGFDAFPVKRTSTTSAAPPP